MFWLGLFNQSTDTQFQVTRLCGPDAVYITPQLKKTKSKTLTGGGAVKGCLTSSLWVITPSWWIHLMSRTAPGITLITLWHQASLSSHCGTCTILITLWHQVSFSSHCDNRLRSLHIVTPGIVFITLWQQASLWRNWVSGNPDWSLVLVERPMIWKTRHAISPTRPALNNVLTL